MSEKRKSRKRFNYRTNQWDDLFFINTDVVIFSGITEPDGTPRSFKVPWNSQLIDTYRNKPA